MTDSTQEAIRSVVEQGAEDEQPRSPERNIWTVLAKGLSLLFHPYTMGLWMAVLLMYGYASQLRFPAPLRRFVISNVAITTVVIPILFNLLLRLFGVTRRDTSNGRRVEIMRLTIAALCYICCGVMFVRVPLLFLLRKMLFLGAIVLVVLLVMEFFRPISHHTLAYGAVLGYMWVLLFVGNAGLLYCFIIALLGAGLLITARLYLTHESPRRVCVPLFVGFFLSFACSLFV